MNMTVLFKKCSYGILLTTLVIGSFCSAEIIAVSGNGNRYTPSSIRINAKSTVDVSPVWNGEILPYSNVCFSLSTYVNCTYNDITYGGTNQTVCFFNKSNDTINFSMPCTNSDTYYTNIYTFTTTALNSSLFECEECQECPIIDSQYCIENNLCPSEGGSGDEETSRSALYINDIQHPGSALINITIPEELQRDYTGDEEEMNIDVKGYGYDQEKMQQLVNTQYYTPTPEDMSNLVGKVADFLPLLAIMLLIVRAWYLIKKVF